MTKQTPSVLAIALCTLALPAPVLAQDAPNTPPAVRQLLDCRGVAEPAVRLACFDRQAALVATAVNERELVVVDRAQVREVRRSVFGFSAADPLPFATKREEVPDLFEGKIGALSPVRGGRYQLQVDDTVWELLETGAFQRVPKVGDAVVIKRGMLGSYKLSVDGRSGLRAKRLK